MKNRVLTCLAAATLVAFLAPALVLLTFLTPSLPGAQASIARGTLRGMVTDPSGAAIPGASVAVSAGHFAHTVSTDDTGQYMLSGLLPGHYRVQIHSAGFSAFDKSGLVVSAGYETDADAQLVIRASKQEITVTAAPVD